MSVFSKIIQQTVTYDTDSGRVNSNPSALKEADGRLSLFYQKDLNSGLISGGRVTEIPATLLVNVTSGTGEVNSIPVSWAGDILSLTPSSYYLVYVHSSGILGATVTFPMAFVKDVVVLAYVSTGSTTITKVYPVEGRGCYIYYRRQVLSGSDWVWNDNEYPLCVGSTPIALYDSTLGRVYLTYQRDQSTFVRVINVADPLSWEYLRHYFETSGILYPDPQPIRDTLVSVDGSESIMSITNPILFSLFRNLVQGFRTSALLIYLYLSPIDSLFKQYIVGLPKVEVFTKSGSVYTLEDSFEIPLDEDYQGFSQLWNKTSGLKYLGVRVTHTLYSGDYVTSPEDYLQINIQPDQDYTYAVDSTHYVTNVIEVVREALVDGSVSKVEVTRELELLRGFADENFNSPVDGSQTEVLLTEEFIVKYGVESDSLSVTVDSSVSVMVITNS